MTYINYIMNSIVQMNWLAIQDRLLILIALLGLLLGHFSFIINYYILSVILYIQLLFVTYI